MPIKLKQMSDDALVTIQVNKNYYEMVKGLSFYLFTLIKVDDKHVYLKEIIDKKPEELDDLQKAFYTVTLLIAEIELPTESTLFDKPSWLGKEVTGASKFYNSSLAKKPYSNW